MTNKELKTWGIVIALMVFLFVAVQKYFEYHFTKLANKYSIQTLDSNLQIFEEEQEKPYTSNKYPNHSYSRQYDDGYEDNKTETFNLHSFNLNSVSEEDMVSMNFPKGLIKNIVNFRNSGGKFYKPEQIKKLFSFKEEWYPQFEKKLVFENSNTQSKFETTNSKKKNMDMNSISEIELDAEWGVSPKIAKNIINYRNALGGFFSIKQLKEIYSLPDSVLQHNLDHWIIEIQHIKKININSITVEELRKHPYFRKDGLANQIISYRTQHGPFKKPTDLLKILNLSTEKYNYIAPYININL